MTNKRNIKNKNKLFRLYTFNMISISLHEMCLFISLNVFLLFICLLFLIIMQQGKIEKLSKNTLVCCNLSFPFNHETTAFGRDPEVAQ